MTAKPQPGLVYARDSNPYQAQYRRLAGRRGKKRATMAVAHSLLVVFYHLLKDRELGREKLPCGKR